MSGRPPAVRLLTASEALEVVNDEFGLGFADRASPRPWLAVDVSSRSSELSALEEVAGTVPCVVIGVSGDAVEAPIGFDVLVSGAPAERPWVHADDLGADLAQLVGQIEDSPLASVALVQLLRLGPSLSLPDAVVAESFVYSMLQAGPRFKEWLEARGAPRDRGDQDPEPVLVTRDGPTLEIELHRPSVCNALNAAMRDALLSALQLVAVDPSITSCRLRGSGPAFCSGGDLNEFGSAPDPATAHSVRVSRSVGLALARCAERVVVEVHGACIGAGIEIPAFAGRITAAADTTFSLPEIGFGLVPGAGGTASLPRRIGRHRSAYAALSGAPIDAATAFEWGLVDELRG